MGLFYTWFAVANLYLIFLYGHLEATPFDAITRSRYWMAGLVATGFVLVAYSALHWTLGRFAALRHRKHRPPDWWRIWLLCALPLGVGILWITMRLNWPTLPLGLALACVASALAGLALALAPASIVAQQPIRLIWTILYGLGVVPSLLLVRAVELTELTGALVAYAVAVAAPLAGALWIALLRRVRVPRPTPVELAVAALCIGYLLLPVAHYLLFTPPDYRYITASANFFAATWGVQLLTFGVAGGLVAWATGMRSK